MCCNKLVSDVNLLLRYLFGHMEYLVSKYTLMKTLKVVLYDNKTTTLQQHSKGNELLLVYKASFNNNDNKKKNVPHLLLELHNADNRRNLNSQLNIITWYIRKTRFLKLKFI